MSYILEALKKSDQEHGIGDVPDLATPHEVNHPQARSYRWLWIVVTLLSVNAALIVMLLKDKRAEDVEVLVTAQAQIPLERQPVLINDQPVQPVQQASEALIDETPTPKNPVLSKNGRVLSGGEVVVLAEPAYIQDSRPSILPEEPDVQAGARATAKDYSQLQNWYELPEEIRNRINLPRLDVHVYSKEPQERFILVSLKKYHEGETLASGLVLEEILPDGMVMSYQGVHFRVEK